MEILSSLDGNTSLNMDGRNLKSWEPVVLMVENHIFRGYGIPFFQIGFCPNFTPSNMPMLNRDGQIICFCIVSRISCIKRVKIYIFLNLFFLNA